MATDATIGALRIILGADIAQFADALSQAEKRFNKFEAAIKKIGAALGVSLGIGATVAALKSAVDTMDELSKASQRLGLPIEELSALRYAAKISGVEFDTLSQNISKFNKNMSQVAGGAVTPAAEAFKAMRVELRNSDGSLKSNSQLLGEVADKFRSYEDGANKSALAQVLFTKSGDRMIPFLNQGSDGIRNATAEAEKFGQIVGADAGQAAEELKDNMDRLGAIMEGVTLRVTTLLLREMNELGNSMVDTAKDGEGLERTAAGIARTIELIVFVVKGAITGISAMGSALNGLIAALLKMAGLDFKGALDALAKGFTDANTKVLSFGTTMDRTFPGTFGPAIREHVNQVHQMTEEYEKAPPPILKTKDALDKFFESTRKAIALRQAEVATFGQSEAAQARLKVLTEGETIAKENNIKMTDAQRKQLQALGLDAGNAAGAMERLNIIQSNLEPWQLLEQEIRKINEAFAGVPGGAELAAAAIERTAERAGVSWKKAAPEITGAFAEIAQSFSKENKGMAKAAQILGAAQALIATFVGQAEALKLPFPANLAAAALIAAKGFALVAAIRSQPIGMAQGGSFKVPGGVSGVDNTFVPLMLASGEQVDVTPSGGRGERATTVNITLQGDTVSRNAVRELFDTLNAGIRDGYRIKMA